MDAGGEASDAMATTDSTVADVSEPCEACDRVTPHRVAVEILTESSKPENAEYSREPYRVSTCGECGAVTRTRMNNA